MNNDQKYDQNNDQNNDRMAQAGEVGKCTTP